MTLWLDNQLPPALAAWMRSTLSVDGLSVRDLHLHRASDAAIFEAAREAPAVVMTKPPSFPAADQGCYSTWVTFSIELEREDDGRWMAEVPSLAGVMCYGVNRDDAVARVQALALRVIADRLEHQEAPAEFLNVTFQAA